MQKYNVQKTPPWMFEIPQINLELKNRKGKDDCVVIFREIMQKYTNHDLIYTDGSKSETATSSVALTLTTNVIKKSKYNHYISINTAEALAIT
jgi:hypothetical protein